MTSKIELPSTTTSAIVGESFKDLRRGLLRDLFELLNQLEDAEEADLKKNPQDPSLPRTPDHFRDLTMGVLALEGTLVLLKNFRNKMSPAERVRLEDAVANFVHALLRVAEENPITNYNLENHWGEPMVGPMLERLLRDMLLGASPEADQRNR